MNRQTKLKLVEKLNNEFEDLLSKKQRANYGSYMRAINEEVIDKVPKSKKEIRDIVKKYQVDTKVSAQMFTVLSGVENYLLNDPTRKSRELLKPLEPIMRAYSVKSPKTFAQGIYDMTAGRNTSERSKRFKPALLSYYDGFTENIESLDKQNQRALQRTEVEKVSQVFKDLEDLREARVPIREAKQILIDKYNDPKRVTTALNTELHEQAERTKLEQSKFMGYTHKRWNTQGDERVRRTSFHNSVKGKIIPVDSAFKGGGQSAEYPGDVALDVGERINCRCFITYHNEPQAKISTRNVIIPPTFIAAPSARPTPPQPTIPIAPTAQTRRLGRQRVEDISEKDFLPPNQNVANSKLSKELYEETVDLIVRKVKENANLPNDETRDNIEYLYRNQQEILKDVKVVTTDKDEAYYNHSQNKIVTPNIKTTDEKEKEYTATVYMHEAGHALDANIYKKLIQKAPFPQLSGAKLSSFQGYLDWQMRRLKLTSKQKEEFQELRLKPYLNSLPKEQIELIEKTISFEESVDKNSKRKDLRTTETFNYVDNFTQKYKLASKEERKVMSFEEPDLRHASDILDALSKGRYLSEGTVIFGHGKSYYNNNVYRASEIFTELGTIRLRNPKLYETIKRDFPDMVESYEDLINKSTDMLREQEDDQA